MTAFERFANGELRVPGAAQDEWNGEPDGWLVFGFAEFAFMALDHGVNPAEWTAVLPSHVAIQQIFARVYRPPRRTQLLYGSYVPANYPLNLPLNDQEKAALRARFSGLDPDELREAAGQHAHDTFHDEGV